MAHLDLEESILGTVADVTGSDKVDTWVAETRHVIQSQGPKEAATQVEV